MYTEGFELPVLLLSRSLENGVNFAFVMTPKSAVKSGRRTRRIFSNNTISLARRTYAQMKVLDPFIHTSFSNTHSYDKDCILCTVTDTGVGR